MAIKELLEDIDSQVALVNSAGFDVEVIDTKYVPAFSDPNITYDNFDTLKTKCKRLESCVLYIDIRDSAKISAQRRPKTLAKMYSSFIRAAIRCARYFDGHVRNIVGDRVMVVFDQENCYRNAVDTAILLNSACEYVLNKRIKNFEFRAGIGIDYGTMLITKAGAIRHGGEKEFYRGLLWLGQPANVASRLTDLAHKRVETSVPAVSEGLYFPNIDDWHWNRISYSTFLDRLKPNFSRFLTHTNEYFSTFFKIPPMTHSTEHLPILMTARVFEGFKKAEPNRESVRKKWWRKVDIDVKDYSSDVYGGDVIFTAAREL